MYFCDPKSPWQRVSDENTNGLLRQYLPRRLDFRTPTQDDLDAIALELNERLRQTLCFKTPSQALAEVGPTKSLANWDDDARFRDRQTLPARWGGANSLPDG